MALAGALLFGLTPILPRQVAVASDEPGTSLLASGTSIGGEIAGGQVHAFEIGVSRDDRVRVTLTKGDLRLAVTVTDPGGGEVVTFTSRRYEPINVSFIAQSDGPYALRVLSLEQGDAPRAFEVAVAALAPTTATDRREDEAIRGFAEAERAGDEWTEAGIRRAIDSYTGAAAVWREIGHHGDAARALQRAGDCHFTLGEAEAALDSFESARSESRSARDEIAETRAINGIGRVFSYSFDGQKALDSADRSLARLRRPEGQLSVDERRLEAEAFCIKGEGYYLLGRLPDALKLFERALEISTEIGDRAGQALAYLDLGYTHADSGEIQMAAESHGRALDLWRAVGDQRGEALSLTATGGIHSFLNERQIALDLHKKALEILVRIGDRPSEAVVLNDLARTYEELNESQTALEYYSAALDIFEKTKNRDAQSVSLYYIGRLHRLSGETALALDFCTRSRDLCRELGKLRLEGYVLTEIAAIQAVGGHPQEALETFRSLLHLYSRIGDRLGRVGVLNQIGDTYMDAGESRTALGYYGQALPLCQAAKDRASEILTHYKIARAARGLGEIDEALSHLDASIRLTETARAQIAGQALRTSYFAGASVYYEADVDLLMQVEKERPGQGYDTRALEVNESRRARALLDMLAETGPELRQGVDPSLLERERALEDQLSGKAQYLMRLLNDESTVELSSDVEEELRRLTLEYDEVEARIRTESPRYATLSRPRPLGLAEIQQQLDDDTILLEYALGTERSYLWTVTSRSLAAYELPGRTQIESSAQELRRLLTSQAGNADQADDDWQDRTREAERQYVLQASALSTTLLGQVADQLAGKRLLIVPDGALQYLPFDALPVPIPNGMGQERSDPNGADTFDDFVPLAVENEVVTLPSASLLTVIRQEASLRTRAEKTVFVLADPVFDAKDSRIDANQAPIEDAREHRAELDPALRDVTYRDGSLELSRLEYTKTEANNIVEAAPSGQSEVALGFDASRATALGDRLRGYQIVHFATHGVVDDKHPELSGIVLSLVDEQGNAQKGFLQLHDIYNLDLNAELVVLSACDTGLGKDVKGEGLVGLTRACYYAGARSVIASLWKVDDTATSELMCYFYRAMLVEGARPSAALRAAKIAMWQQPRWRAPYYWAAFVLQGDPETTIVVGPAKWPVWPIVVSLGLLALAIGVYVLKRKSI